MALFSTAKEKETVRRASYQTGLLAAQGLESVEAEKARAMAAERAATDIYGRLGAPGTFETPTGPVTPMAPTDIYDTSSPLAQKSEAAQGLLSKYTRLKKNRYGEVVGIDKNRSNKYGTGAETLFGTREGILDPEKYGDKVAQSAQFRIQSRQTAEAEQLLKQEGPMWDMLYNSTIGQIYEGAAIANREALRVIRNGLAKGGTARRTAFAQAQELRQIETAHRMRVNETWNANLKLHEYVRHNADRVQDGNIKFLSNLPELRASYTDTMTKLTNLLTGQVIPYSMQGIKGVSDSVTAVQAKDGAFLEGLIQMGITAVVGAFTGGAAGALTSVMSSSVPGSSAAASPAPNIEGFNNAQFAGATASPPSSGFNWKQAATGALKGAGSALFGE